MGDPLYNTIRWRLLRLRQLKREPLCRYCLDRGEVEPAKIVDHVIPHRGDKELFFHGELQSLCETHHNGSKQSEERRGYSREVGIDGYPVDPRHPASEKTKQKIKNSLTGGR